MGTDRFLNGVPVTVAVIVLGVDLIVAALVARGVGHAAQSLELPAERTAGVADRIRVILLAVIAMGLIIGAFRPDPAEGLQVVVFLTYVLALAVAGFAVPLRSETTRRIIDAAPHPWLVGIQLYRTVGGLFLVLAPATLPRFFATPAGVGDLIAGIGAIPVAYMIHRRAPGWFPVAMAWNAFGALDYLMALGIGSLILRAPAVAIFGDSVTSTTPLPRLPLVAIPTFVVPLGLALHAHSIRRLLRERSGRQEPVQAGR